MFRRRQPVARRGPGLAGTVARTAVVAGTATATANAVNSRPQHQHQAAATQAQNHQAVTHLEQQVADLQAQQVQSQLGALQPNADPAIDLTAQLGRLAQLLEAGHLTQDEFNAAKAKLLDS